MLWLILALIASEVAMLLIGPRVLPVLRKLKFGQTIYELGPKSHRTKQGTPTMGGLMFAAVTCVVTLLIVSFDTWYGGWDFAWRWCWCRFSACSSALWTTSSRSLKSATSA